MHARPPSTLLQQLIQQREVSYEQLVRELADFARTREIDATIGVRHLQRLARQERSKDRTPPAAQPGTRRLLREFFEFSFDELVGPPRLETLAAPRSSCRRPLTPVAWSPRLRPARWTS